MSINQNTQNTQIHIPVEDFFGELPVEIIIQIYKQLAFDNSMKELSNLVFLNKRLYSIFWNYIKERGPDQSVVPERGKLIYVPWKIAVECYKIHCQSPKRYYGIRFDKTDFNLRKLLLDEKDHYIIRRLNR